MTELLSTSDGVPSPKSLTLKPLKKPMVAYPSFKTREQFWWRQDGQPVVPTIDHLLPDSAPAGGSDLRLYVHGTGFMADSVIVFNDNEEPTTMDASGILSTGVRAGMFEVPADVEVKVKTGDEESNVLIFHFV